MKRAPVNLILIAAVAAMAAVYISVPEFAGAQSRRPKRVPARRTQAPRGSAAKYSAFLHSSNSHKSLACNACHKIPTTWTAKRDFPDVADFPDHDACVRCHRQQFFTRQVFIGTGPAICTVCHVRAAPREDARFAFGKPNNSNQAAKPKDERQFTIEFPHDKHQNVIASLRSPYASSEGARIVRASFLKSDAADDKPKADYNNCSICHQTNNNLVIVPLAPWAEAAPDKPYKTMPRTHDACFDCHWKNQEPIGTNCAGCHKHSDTFVAVNMPKRISAKFSHEGGKGEHVQECTSCHINITRATTLRGLTPDVPITICATCHKDSKKTTYPKMTSIEDEFAQFKKTSNCTYCHTDDVGRRKAPPSHEAAVQ